MRPRRSPSERVASELATWTLWLNSWLLVATVWPGIVLYLLVFPSGLLPSRRWRPFVIGLLALSVLGVVARMAQPWEGEPITNPVCDPGRLVGRRHVVRGDLAGLRRGRDRRRRLGRPAVPARLLVRPAGAAVAGGRRRSSPPRSSWWRSRPARSVSTGSVIRSGSRSCSSVVLGLPLVRGGRAARASPPRYRGRGEPLPRLREPRSHDHGDLRGGRGGASAASWAVAIEPNVFAAVAATAVAAVVFQPARRRAHRFADRLIYGDRASPYQLLATFTERLDEASLPEVLPRMTALVAEGTGAERVLDLAPHRHRAASRRLPGRPGRRCRWPMQLDDGELPSMHDPAFAVRHGGELLGAITVAMPPQEPLTPATERLLDDLSVTGGARAAQRRARRGAPTVAPASSSPRRTRRGGGSSATCTTARSSGW